MRTCIFSFLIAAAVAGCKRPGNPSAAANNESPKPAAAQKSQATEPPQPDTKPKRNNEVVAPELQTAMPMSGSISATNSGLVAQTWTTQRIIALTPSGPIIIDLAVNVGGVSLEEATQQAIDRAVEAIAKDLPKPWKWESFLEHPLVKSGWLGNLLPMEDQRDQLISMYNLDGDDEVDPEELAPFFTRGLARGTPLRFTDAGAISMIQSQSPWGALDTNKDNSLDVSEMETIVRQASTYDLNGDRIITQMELRGMEPSPNDTGSMNGGGRSMLDSNTALAVDPEQPPSRVAGKLFEHYGYLIGVTREQWSAWHDTEWRELDEDQDGQLTKREMEKVVSVPPHINLRARFPVFSLETQPASDEASIQGTTSDPKQLAWERRIVGSGQLNGTDFTLLVTMTDGYSDAARSSTRRQLAAALGNPNLAEFVRTQLQLGENAFKVLDADQDGELNDDEFALAWGWMSGVRGTRAIARWSLTESSWFQLADRDGDGRLTELELGRLVHRIVALDKDGDGLVSPNEAPLAMRLEISRADSRLATLSGALPQTDQTTRSTADWFAAMDANDDGFISNLEFLGSKEDFDSYDADSDGYISRPEGFPH